MYWLETRKVYVSWGHKWGHYFLLYTGRDKGHKNNFNCYLRLEIKNVICQSICWMQSLFKKMCQHCGYLHIHELHSNKEYHLPGVVDILKDLSPVLTFSLLALCLQSTDPLKSARLFTVAVCCWNIMYTRFFSFWIHQYESTLHYTWHKTGGETGGSAGEAESDKSRKAWDIFFFKPDKISLMISSWGKKGGLLIFPRKKMLWRVC